MPCGHANLALEYEIWAQGFTRVAGIDEVGRGAWAGPVVAAAVILPPNPAALVPLLGRVDDSKRLTPRARMAVLEDIHACAVAVGVGFSPAEEVDAAGIVPATRNAMLHALATLDSPPDFLLLDYLTLPMLAQPQRGVPHGDALSLSIAAASIVAKVTRDLWMAEQEDRFPNYGFAHHKGYGVAAHRAALERLGPCLLHRRSFRPLAVLARSSDAR
jgi:ribonuclease HII